MQVQTEERPPMQQNPFTSFINLISLDQEIRSIHHLITTLKQETESSLVEKQKLIDRFEQFKQHVHDLKKSVHEKELAMKELDTQEKTKKAQLDQLTNPKEYQPLKKEIDRLKQKQHDAEATLMAIWNKLEVAQKELEEQQSNYKSKIEELHEAIAKQQEQMSQLQTKLDQKKSERPTKETGIPHEWLDKYSHMRMRVENPVVPILNGSCSACFYTIPSQELIRLKRRAIVQCKGCFRLLYMQEAMEEQAAEPSDSTDTE